MALVVIHSTVALKSQAQKLARALLQKRLAACIQILGPIESHYEWKSKVYETKEYLIQIKTLQSKVSAIETYFASAHPYEVPEFIVIPIDRASKAYKKWVMTL